MFTDICFTVKGNTIELNGQRLLLGEFTAKCLNISPEDYRVLHDLKLSIEEEWSEEMPGEEKWLELNKLLLSLSSALRQHSALALLSDENAEVFLRDFSQDTEIFTEEGWEFYCHIADQFVSVVDDLYAFNQTIFNFITKYLMNLKQLNPPNYAAAYYEFFHSPAADKLIVSPFAGDSSMYSGMDFLEMNLIPMERKQGGDDFVIAEVYHTDSLQSLLRIDFLKGLMVGHHIRRCQHCKRFFVLTKGYKTKYCDNPAPENPKFTCAQMSYRSTRKKEENADNPKYQTYRRCMERIMRSCQRGSISEQQRNVLLHKAEELYHEAITSPKYTNEEFEQMLQSKQLYQFCGIEPPKRGRPKRKHDK